ncbi:ATPase AAA family [Perkinsela sp. CCAP 1560/4]|nr:ATPase AAA family [Perkinsela sp. CCAP 1560/4]|eukprot:KNH07640.1 ATPase AAA family [Perkinsela sp. CCAP 1560/4]
METLLSRKRQSAMESARQGLALCRQWGEAKFDPVYAHVSQATLAKISQTCEDIQFLLHSEADASLKEVYVSILNTFRQIFARVETRGLQGEQSGEPIRVGSSSEKEESGMSFLHPSEISVSWESIIGNEVAKEKIAEALLYPEYLACLSQYDHTLSHFPLPSSTILLYGPPGTGKTMLVKAAAKAFQFPICNVTAADFLSKWLGETEKCIRQLFQALKRTSRCILFMDEVDSIFSVRARADGTNTVESEVGRRVKTEFLICLQELLDSKEFSGYFIAATNLPEEIDPAFLRRFDVRISVDLPSRKARRQFLQVKAPEMSDEDLENLAVKLHGQNYAGMETIWRAAQLRTVREHIQEPTHENTSKKLRPVQLHDIEIAIKQYVAICQ